jgi:hypothetical protein
MRQLLFILVSFLAISNITAQQLDSTWTFNGNNGYSNSATRLLNTNGKLVIGGYATKL